LAEEIRITFVYIFIPGPDVYNAVDLHPLVAHST
jgi:hypothetical protein